MEEIKSTLIEATLEAGKILKEHFHLNYKISTKTEINNLVTEIDKKAEKAIIDIIHKHYPKHNIWSEEIGEIITESNIKWIIDPLDGTTNYSRKLPLCSVSIGIEKNNTIILGAIYNPFLDEFYIAEKNEGSFLNNKRIYVSKNDNIQTIFLATSFSQSKVHIDNEESSKIFTYIATKGIPVRRIGSSAINLSWVASGKFDAFYSYYIEPWDCAAGILLVEEAGGKITNFANKEFTYTNKKIVVSNGIIHNDLIETIQKAKNEHILINNTKPYIKK